MARPARRTQRRKRPRGATAPASENGRRRVPAAADYSELHRQLELYARDLNRLLKSERRSRSELAATHQQLMLYVADLKKSFESEKRRAREVNAAFAEALRRLTIAAECRNEETARHINRISYYARVLAEALGWSSVQAELIYEAAPMHDIGKIGVPDAVLLKRAPLDTGEWEVMRMHPIMGERILAGSSSPLVRMGAEIAACHHERWDGSGYPRGLKGENVPTAAHMVMLCDVYDALRSRRPYKPAFSHEHACEIIFHGDDRTRPAHFDPRLLAVFAEINGEFANIYARHRDESARVRAQTATA